MTYLTDRDYILAGVDRKLINPATFNVTLATIRRMTPTWRDFIVSPNVSQQFEFWKVLGKPDVKDLSQRDKFFDKEEILEPGVDYYLLPGEYALFSTVEKVSFRNGQAGLLFIRSGDARGGVDQFNTFIDPGFGYPEPTTLVLEIINNAPWPKIIKGGQQIAQIFTLTGPESLESYDGSYKNQEGAEPPR